MTFQKFRLDSFQRILLSLLVMMLLLAVVRLNVTAKQSDVPLEIQREILIKEALSENAELLYANVNSLEAISHPLSLKVDEEGNLLQPLADRDFLHDFTEAYSSSYLLPEESAVVTYFLYKYESPEQAEKVASFLSIEVSNAGQNLDEKGHLNSIAISDSENGTFSYWLINYRGNIVDLILIDGASSEALKEPLDNISGILAARNQRNGN